MRILEEYPSCMKFRRPLDIAANYTQLAEKSTQKHETREYEMKWLESFIPLCRDLGVDNRQPLLENVSTPVEHFPRCFIWCARWYKLRRYTLRNGKDEYHLRAFFSNVSPYVC